ncbi:hypothetical protein [Bradyrhizobium lablabi]|uniref:hypothetical protein n=1 Tax=Bradyrhizobium lablabi TaxID=722472 RepID=UPI0012ABE99F|nr:hypothetical protein [Bradyrhizobium lablabi]
MTKDIIVLGGLAGVFCWTYIILPPVFLPQLSQVDGRPSLSRGATGSRRRQTGLILLAFAAFRHVDRADP